MAVIQDTTNQVFAIGMVTGVHGVAGDIVSAVTYDFKFWTLDERTAIIRNSQSIRRTVPDDTEILEPAPLGFPASFSFVGGNAFAVLLGEGEKYATEEC